MNTRVSQLRATRRSVLGGAGLAATIPFAARAQDATPIGTRVPGGPPLTDGDWPLYGHDSTGNRATADGIITTATVVGLAECWTVEQSAPAASPAAISNDLVFHAGFDGILRVYGLQDGAELWSAELGASVSGEIAVSSGVVVLGVVTPVFAPFITPGNLIHGLTLPSDNATPVDAATPGNEAPPAATPVS